MKFIGANNVKRIEIMSIYCDNKVKQIMTFANNDLPYRLAICFVVRKEKDLTPFQNSSSILIKNIIMSKFLCK